MSQLLRTLALSSLLCSPMALAAESYTWGNVAFEGGGFVDAIVPSRTQPGLVYARTDVGGAYRWDSTGGKWIPLLDWLSNKNLGLMGTEALALDPQDSKRLYILAGTSYFNDGKSMILRSKDYGATFDTVNVTAQFKSHGNGLGRQTGEKLAVDPQNSAIVFCGTRTAGLFRSADTGRTWTLVPGTTSLSGSSLNDNAGISFVLFDPTSAKTAGGGTSTIYVGSSNTAAALSVSKDGGATFTAVTGGPAQMPGRAVLSLGTLYLSYTLGQGPFNLNGGSVWKYGTSTRTWTKITPKDAEGYDYATGREGYGYGFGGIAVDPHHPARLILSTLSCYGGQYRWPTANKGNAGEIFFLSDDSGATWKSLNGQSADDGTSPNVSPNGNAWITGSSIHWGGDIAFDPFDAKKVWVTSGNGTFRTDDVDAAGVVWNFQSKGIEETVPMEVVSVPGGPLVTAIMDYDGSTYDDIHTTGPLHEHPIGSSNSLGYAAKTGAFLRSGRVTDYGVKPAVTYDALYLSRDEGRTWTLTDTSSLPGSAGSLAMSADGRVFLLRPSNLHSGTGSSSANFYRSTDQGKTWTTVKGLSAQKGLMVADPVNPARFYIIPDGYTGDVWASSDTGANFAKVGTLADNAKGLYPASSSLIRVVPGTEGEIWAPGDAEQIWTSTGYSANGLLHSLDGGKTWTQVKTMTACLAVGLGKAAPGATYPTLFIWGVAAGGPLGVYRSIDKGETWTRINDDAHQYGGLGNGQFVVGDWNTYGRVYMSTAGRGIVVGEIAGTTGISTRHAAARGALVLSGDRLLVDVEPGATDLRLELRDGAGRILSSRGLGESRSVSLAGPGAHGVLFARLLSGTRIVAATVLARP